MTHITHNVINGKTEKRKISYFQTLKIKVKMIENLYIIYISSKTRLIAGKQTYSKHNLFLYKRYA